mmetsp:Transcript_22433/g.58475  ORF Transcript_22433/g.58475 Transcript_22433/m.58475 type:complete len:228 (+) Transcript_22433:176-859(+)
MAPPSLRSSARVIRPCSLRKESASFSVICLPALSPSVVYVSMCRPFSIVPLLAALGSRLHGAVGFCRCLEVLSSHCVGSLPAGLPSGCLLGAQDSPSAAENSITGCPTRRDRNLSSCCAAHVSSEMSTGSPVPGSVLGCRLTCSAPSSRRVTDTPATADAVLRRSSAMAMRAMPIISSTLLRMASGSLESSAALVLGPFLRWKRVMSAMTSSSRGLKPSSSSLLFTM